MVKRALCVGINRYPRPELELRGCVNDAKAWATLLTTHYDFTTADVRAAHERQGDRSGRSSRRSATCSPAPRRGDVLVFTNSSHGTYVADRGRRRAPLRRGDRARTTARRD